MARDIALPAAQAALRQVVVELRDAASRGALEDAGLSWIEVLRRVAFVVCSSPPSWLDRELEDLHVATLQPGLGEEAASTTWHMWMTAAAGGATRRERTLRLLQAAEDQVLAPYARTLAEDWEREGLLAGPDAAKVRALADETLHGGRGQQFALA